MVVSPSMRCQRTMMSISVWLSMCPMCRLPVTLGGGSSSVNALSGFAAGVGTSKSRSFTQYSAHFFSMVPGSYALGNSRDIKGFISLTVAVLGRRLWGCVMDEVEDIEAGEAVAPQQTT